MTTVEGGASLDGELAAGCVAAGVDDDEEEPPTPRLMLRTGG